MINWNEIGGGGTDVSNNSDYLDFAFVVVSQLEGFLGGRPYLDSLGIPTIGYGFNLRAPNTRAEVLEAFDKLQGND